MIGKKLMTLGIVLVVIGLAIHFVRLILSAAGSLALAGIVLLAVGYVMQLLTGPKRTRSHGDWR